MQIDMQAHTIILLCVWLYMCEIYVHTISAFT